MNTKQYIGALNNISLNIHMGEVCQLDSKWKCTNVCSPFTRFYFVKSGSGFLETEKQHVDMTGGNIYIIPSEHKFTSGCTTLEKAYFHITVTSVERYDLLSRLDSIHTINCGNALIEEVERCFFSDDYSDMVKLRAILFDTVAALMKYISVPVVYYSPIVERVIAYINDNLSAKLSVSEIAGLFFISESKLRNLFKEETGMPIGKYIDDMIFIKAKQMLTREDRSIAEISARLGFCDRFYFSGRFAQKVGVPPAKFRAQNREGLNTKRRSSQDK